MHRPSLRSGLNLAWACFRSLAGILTKALNYTVSAVCKTCHGNQVDLVDLSASMMTDEGCTAPQVLSFFKFNGVYELDTLKLRCACLGLNYSVT
jgi:hypothetical protein